MRTLGARQRWRSCCRGRPEDSPRDGGDASGGERQPRQDAGHGARVVRSRPSARRAGHPAPGGGERPNGCHSPGRALGGAASGAAARTEGTAGFLWEVTIQVERGVSMMRTIGIVGVLIVAFAGEVFAQPATASLGRLAIVCVGNAAYQPHGWPIEDGMAIAWRHLRCGERKLINLDVQLLNESRSPRPRLACGPSVPGLVSEPATRLSGGRGHQTAHCSHSACNPPPAQRPHSVPFFADGDCKPTLRPLVPGSQQCEPQSARCCLHSPPH